MTISHDDMRRAILAALASGTQPRDFESFKYNVAWVLRERGHRVESGSGGQCLLHRGDWRAYRDSIWELISESILAIGMDSNNENWPFLGVTEYGARVIEGADATPHDASAFIQSLTRSRPLDEIENRFLVQALRAFQRSLWDAAAVMVGAASEHLVEVLMEELAQHDNALEPVMRRLARRPALEWMQEAQKYLTPRRKSLPQVLRDNHETMFASLATAIRVARNDAGHPSGAEVQTRERAYAGLELYRIFRGWIVALRTSLPLGPGLDPSPIA